MAQVMQATVIADPDDANYQLTIGKDQVQKYLQAIERPGADSLRKAPRREFTLPQSQADAMQVSQVDWSGENNGEFSHPTTHHVAADQNGMVVIMTQTLGPNFGAKVMTPGLGFLHAQTGGMPQWLIDIEPGTRLRTSIAPTIVLKNGEPIMAWVRRVG